MGNMIMNLNEGWKFIKAHDLDDRDVCSGGEWEDVTLPHTWNSNDGTHCGAPYDRTSAWYRKELYIDDAYREGRIYLEFGAAGTVARLYINGEPVPFARYDIYNEGHEIEYTHKGGFSKLRFDVTEFVRYGETNSVAVYVDNRRVADIAPLGGDFNLQGGLYRYARLIVTPSVHFDMDDCGSDGVYITTAKKTEPTDNKNTDFNMTVAARVINDSDIDRVVTVNAELWESSEFTVPENEYIKAHLVFDPETMYTKDGKKVMDAGEETVSIKSGGSFDFYKTVEVKSPRLWDGLRDPYRYEIRLRITENGKPITEFRTYIGFKYCYMPAPVPDGNGGYTGGGFYLNGRKYVLRGAGKHQDVGRGIGAKGFALTYDDMLNDAGIIYELGMNSVRLVHYQHSNEEIELYDRLGILVWSELGFVDSMINANSDGYEAFLNVTAQQFRELIKQHYNHPSVFVWSMSNEIGKETDAALEVIDETRLKVPSGYDIFQKLNAIAHELDPIRSTTYAAFSFFGRTTDWDSDSAALNLYPYWYTDHPQFYHGGNVSMTDQVKYHLGGLDIKKPVGISEYGASAVVGYIAPFASDGTVAHPGMMSFTTTYQAYCHEKVYHEIVNEMPWIWCSYVWQLFDSTSDSKKSLLVGTNDKGLVSYDHKTKKDAFYFYKANWNGFEPFVYIVPSSTKEIVRAYSNAEELQLYVNGNAYGEPITDCNASDGVADGLHIFRWYDVPDGVISVEICK